MAGQEKTREQNGYMLQDLVIYNKRTEENREMERWYDNISDEEKN